MQGSLLFTVTATQSYTPKLNRNHNHILKPITSQNRTKNFQSITCKLIINPTLSPKPTKKPPSAAEPECEPGNSPVTRLNRVQRLAALVLDKLEALLIEPLERAKKLAETVDPAVQLSGNFAPVRECPVQTGLEVVGQIPECLLGGLYLRNGANPQHMPRGGHHLFDGDGMIHAVKFGPTPTRASYCCSYTRTSRLEQEAQWGRAVFPKPIGELYGHTGLARLALFHTRAGFGLLDPTRGTGVANAGLVFFNGRLLAMSEDDLPYHVAIGCNGELETIGRFDFDSQLDRPMIAHPKVDPITGELHALSYSVVRKPYLKYFRFDTCGKKTRDIGVMLDQPSIIHDFAITSSHVVVPDPQVIFKLSEMVWGGSPMVHDRKKTSRVGILPKSDLNGSSIRWVDIDNCFCFHWWNAWEENEKNDDVIVIIGSCMIPPSSIFAKSENGPIRTELTKIWVNTRTMKSKKQVISPFLNLEAGQINRGFLGQKTRYVYLAIAESWPKCSGIAKVDLETGRVEKYLYGPGCFGGEPFFVPEKRGNNICDEDCGYLMGFVRDERLEKSELVIINASNMERVALVKLPKRVPYGFHGTFVSAQDLIGQVLSY